MIILQISIFFLILSYVVYVYQRHKNERRKHQFAVHDLALAQQKLSEAGDDFTHIEKEIFGLIDQQFGQSYSVQIKNGVVNIGMPTTFLTMAWGHPQRIERSGESNGAEYWFYKEQDTVGRQTKVVIENHQIIKLKDY